MGQFDTAQICENGHAITSIAGSSPQFRKNFCSVCGAPTIMVCPYCKAPIRGRFHQEGIIDHRSFKQPIPTFCYQCGKSHPWTEKRIQAFRELAAELDDLSVEEQQKLNSSLDDLIQAGPKTDMATLRFKKIASKLGRDSYEMLKSVASDILSEAIKKAVFGK